MVRLPSEYQEVEYLESTGTQWIDTGVYPATNIQIETKIKTNTGEQDKPVFGNVVNKPTPNSVATFYHLTCYSYRWYVGTNRTELYGGIYLNNIGVVYNIVFNNTNGDVVINNDYIVRGKTFSAYDSTATIAISYRGSSVGDGNRKGSYIYYYFNMYDKQQQKYIRQYIPCYRKSDHKPGLYDLVTKTLFTNAGTGEFIVGPDVIRHDTPALVLRRRLLLNTPHIETASGSIATFQTDMVGKLKECKIYFEPVQEGEGDPSPDNVRPITGWTGCKVTRCGKNFIQQTGQMTAKSPILPVGTYKLKQNVTNATKWRFEIKGFDADGNNIGHTALNVPNAYWTGSLWRRSADGHASTETITVYKPVTIDFEIKFGDTTSASELVDPMLQPNYASHDYEPYQGTTIPIDWTDEAGTVYGGYVDLVKGEVVAEWVSYLFDGTQPLRYLNTWYNYDRQHGFNSSGFYWYIRNLNLPPAKTGANRTSISDRLTRNIYGCHGHDINYEFALVVSSNSYVAMRLPNDVLDISSASALQNSVMSYLADNPVRIAYEIATPIRYPIDPITLKTLRGTNNIFANTNGNTEVKFYTH